MTPERIALIQALHDHRGRAVMVVAGAGSQALAWLLGVPGASRTLLEALVPYDWAAFDDFLGQTPPQYVADQTARFMAGRALSRARWLHRDEDALVGLACTATIVTDRPKRGEHRAHIATWQPERVVWYRLGLEKGARDRAAEEALVSDVIINALAAAFSLSDRLPLDLTDGDRLAEDTTDLVALSRQVYRHERAAFYLPADGCCEPRPTEPMTILSGAFNPLHEGHLKLGQVSAQRTGQPLVFELTVVNAEKPALAEADILRRMAQFAGRWPVLVGNRPNFVGKSALYPGSVFVVGHDTAVRVIQPRFYGDDEAAMWTALETIRAHGCRFLVGGRMNEEGVFHEASSLDVPDRFADLFESLPAESFRVDISSTHLRETGQRGSR
jgi:hypothetical protein